MHGSKVMRKTEACITVEEKAGAKETGKGEGKLRWRDWKEEEAGNGILGGISDSRGVVERKMETRAEEEREKPKAKGHL